MSDCFIAPGYTHEGLETLRPKKARYVVIGLRAPGVETRTVFGLALT